MMDEKDAARREALEAAVWRSGYRGSAEALEAVLDALADWMDAIAQDHTATLSREIAGAQVEEIDDLQQQVSTLRAELKAKDADWSEKLERIALEHAAERVPAAAYEDYPDTWNGDPYGAALLEAIETEMAQALQYRDAQTLDALYAETAQYPDTQLRGTSDGPMKICRTCGERKAIEEFKIDKAMSGGRRSDCKPCIRRRDREREERKREEAEKYGRR